MCCDPISWFMRAKLISNPSMFVLGKPGLGKSTITRRMALGLAGYGIQPLVLGDLKPDYKDLIEALGGQVIQLGRGRGHLNVLDPGESRQAALRLTGKAREAIQADAHGRRQTMVSALISIMRSAPPTDREETIIDEALKVLDESSRRYAGAARPAPSRPGGTGPGPQRRPGPRQPRPVPADHRGPRGVADRSGRRWPAR